MPKHIPLRSCVACRDNKPKRELVRVVRREDGTVAVDRSGKQVWEFKHDTRVSRAWRR